MRGNDLKAAFAKGCFPLVLQIYRSDRSTYERDPDCLPLVAESYGRTGSWRQARDISQRVLEHPLAGVATKARAMMVLGLAAAQDGAADRAVSLFLQSGHDAESVGDLTLNGWAELGRLKMVAIRGAGEPVVRDFIRRLRRTAIRAADPQLTSALHIQVGEVNTQIGLWDLADRHFRIADTLLGQWPNAWLQSLHALAVSCLYFVRCDRSNALHWSDRARTFLALCGCQGVERALLNNDGHLRLLGREFAAAEQCLGKATHLGPAGHPYRLCILDELARLYLAIDNLDRCEAILDEVDQLAAASGCPEAYGARWSTLTRAQLLERRGATVGSDEAIAAGLAYARSANDVHLSEALLVQQSRVALLVGRERTALHSLYNASQLSAAGSTDTIAAGQQIYSFGLFAEQAKDLSASCHRRALRLYRASGNLLCETEAASEWERLPSTLAQVIDGRGHHAVPTKAEEGAREACAAVGFALALAGTSPRLLGLELADLARCMGYPDPVSVRELPERAGTEAPSPAISGGRAEDDAQQVGVGVTQQIELGAVAGTRFALLAPSPSTFGEALALSAIKTVAQVAVENEEARRERRERLALWPVEELADLRSAVFSSAPMKELLRIAQQIATSPVTVLITGDTGTGKEVLAHAIHDLSERSRKPFVAFNGTAVPRDVMESQLFGFKKGSFTGAVENSAGVVRTAAGGTLFVDEVGELNLDIQPKLLRFLESGEIHPIGEGQPTLVDVRVIAATNADIDKLVAEGRFRRDLFYRLNIIRLHVPPLRDRRDEVSPLVEHFIHRFCTEYRKAPVSVSDETLEYLLLYSWPGNVRQLANEVRRIVALATPGTPAGPELLSPEILQSRRTIAVAPPPVAPHEIAVPLDQPMESAIETLERAMIQHALRKTNGHLEEAARQLGVSRKGLYLKRLRFGFDSPPGSQPPGNTTTAS